MNDNSKIPEATEHALMKYGIQPLKHDLHVDRTAATSANRNTAEQSPYP